MMCWRLSSLSWITLLVSVAGCLGYDVLDNTTNLGKKRSSVSVAGCLGYDVLGAEYRYKPSKITFQLLVV
ncbi:hypothetical protein CRYPA_1195 [uncultured Candidatus Thioglobus sp.]|nr:hypothetical protein CRYPA_1195 [uncultured Candidatus Thioglobus sp.]